MHTLTSVFSHGFAPTPLLLQFWKWLIMTTWSLEWYLSSEYRGTLYTSDYWHPNNLFFEVSAIFVLVFLHDRKIKCAVTTQRNQTVKHPGRLLCAQYNNHKRTKYVLAIHSGHLNNRIYGSRFKWRRKQKFFVLN